MTDGLVENHLDRNTRVRTCQDRSVRFLLIERVLFQDRKVLFMRVGTAGNKTRIAILELLEGRVGAELALGHNRTWPRELYTRCSNNPGHCPGQSHLEK